MHITIKAGLVALLVFLGGTPSFSAIRRICKVQYATGYGWSQEYTMQVEFMTGTELNTATRSYSYDSYSKYCLLWFSNGGVAINVIKDNFLCGFEFDDEAFKNLFFFRTSIQSTQINSKDDDPPMWRITAKDFSGEFFDSRDN